MRKSAGALLKVPFYSLCCSMAQDEEKKEKYRLLKSLNNSRSAPLISSLIFGKSLIAPGINIESEETLFQPVDKEQLAELLKQAALNAPSHVTLSEQSMPEKKITDGVCGAAALKFLKLVLKNERKGKSLNESFLIAAQKMADGVDEKTALIQFIADRAMLKPWLLERTKINEIDTLLGSFFKLSVLETKEILRVNPVVFKTKLANLENGFYSATLLNDEKDSLGHSIAIIKTDDTLYLYDPNCGSAILSIEKLPIILNKIMKFYKFNAAYLSSVSLAPKKEKEAPAEKDAPEEKEAPIDKLS